MKLDVNEKRRAKIYSAILKLRQDNIRPSADKIIKINGGSKDQVLAVLKEVRNITKSFQDLTPILDFLQNKDEGVKTDLLSKIANLEEEVSQLVRANEALARKLLDKESELIAKDKALLIRDGEIKTQDEKVKLLNEKHLELSLIHISEPTRPY